MGEATGWRRRLRQQGGEGREREAELCVELIRAWLTASRL